MFSFLNGPLGWIINICYELVDNYAIALLLFALVMQIILLPFGIKQQKNSVKQARMRPKEMAIRNKYKGRNDRETQQKMQNEILEMYKQENYSTMAGCLPLLIQLPILFALFAVVSQPLTYVSGFEKQDIYKFAIEIGEHETGVDFYNENGVDSEAVKTLTDDQKNILKGYMIWDGETIVSLENFAPHTAEIKYTPLMKKIIAEGNNPFVYTEDGETKPLDSENLPNFYLAGDFMDLSDTPTFEFEGEKAWLLLIPLLTGVFTYGGQFITKKFTYQSTIQENQDAGCSMKVMQYAMPLLSIFISFSMPAAIGLYWIYRNILSTVQTVVLAKIIPLPRFTEEDYKAAERELKGKSPKSDERKSENRGNKVRSLHRIDEDDDIPAAPAKKGATRYDNDDDGESKPVVDTNIPKLKDESDRRADRKNNQ